MAQLIIYNGLSDLLIFLICSWMGPGSGLKHPTIMKSIHILHQLCRELSLFWNYWNIYKLLQIELTGLAYICVRLITVVVWYGNNPFIYYKGQAVLWVVIIRVSWGPWNIVVLKYWLSWKWNLNNYIVRSYRDVILVTNTAARRTNKAYSIVMY